VEAAGISMPFLQVAGIVRKPFSIRWLRLDGHCAKTHENARKRTSMLPGCCLPRRSDIARLNRITQVRVIQITSLLKLDDEVKVKFLEADAVVQRLPGRTTR
jgi:hypothetical protein